MCVCECPLVNHYVIGFVVFSNLVFYIKTLEPNTLTNEEIGTGTDGLLVLGAAALVVVKVVIGAVVEVVVVVVVVSAPVA